MIRFSKYYPVLSKTYCAAENDGQAKAVQFQVIHWIFLKTNRKLVVQMDWICYSISEGAEIKDFQKFFTIPKVRATE